MKIVINILLLLVVHQTVISQVVTDTLPARRPDADTINVATDKLPVLSDTTQYNDTIKRKTASGKDTTIVKKKVHSPRQATIRSAIVPGLGQIYNKKYWKVPIVYAAIGTPMVLFFNNKSWYNKTKYALYVVTNELQGDPAVMAKVDPQLKALVDGKYEGSLLNYRNKFRRDMDYSLLFVLLMWGLNVVDATVDAHLKGFDVGDDLSFKLKPSMFTNTMGPGVSLVVNFK